LEHDLDNKEWQDAIQIVNFTRRSLFLTGKAGTGKTTFIKGIQEKISKNFKYRTLQAVKLGLL
jgi:DNA replication protein DnaC